MVDLCARGGAAVVDGVASVVAVETDDDGVASVVVVEPVDLVLTGRPDVSSASPPHPPTRTALASTTAAISLTA